MTQLIHFGDYAGFRILGTKPMAPCVSSFHVKRASWFTAEVESGGEYGTVQSYDGCGITACIYQAVALYPKEVWEVDNCTEDDQGPLWGIVRRIRDAFPTAVSDVMDMIDWAGWMLGADGKLRRKYGDFPSGKEIRIQINGDVHGVTPQHGPGHDRAAAWVNAFASAMSNGVTFPIQDAAGEEFIVKRATRVPLSSDKQLTIQDALYDGKDIATLTVGDLGPEMDLAMCVFWSHSVNAPGMALQCLNKAIGIYGTPTSQPPTAMTFPRVLMRVLGTCTYGRWVQDLRSGRYPRTRDAAINSGLWPDVEFEHLMPAPVDLATWLREEKS